MINKIEIAPSLLASDLARLADEAKALEQAGADLLHLDVMDGHFVPNMTFGPPVIECLRKSTKLTLDAHLMIENADRYLDDFARAGCNWLSVHVEACPHLHRTLSKIKELGMKAGVAINPGTSLSALDSALEYVDFVLVMSVNPGFGGQRFIEQSGARISRLKQRLIGTNVRIQVDGGLKEENVGQVVDAGADILVIGTGLFSLGDYGKAITTLRKAAQGKA